MLERKMRLQDILSYFLITAKCNERLMLIRVRFFKRPLMKNNEATWLFKTLILLQYKYCNSNAAAQVTVMYKTDVQHQCAHVCMITKQRNALMTRIIIIIF